MEKIKAKLKFPIARSVDAPILAELFLVNSIASIVIIRTFLFLTGYPQLGDGVLHIAHMLWGGLLMLIALLLVILFLGRTRLFIAAVIGGLGFGTFIDELGKFITADNDYFFQPTFALIYLLFVIMYFIFHFAFTKRPLTEKEYLVNASDFIAEMVMSEDYDSQDAHKLKSLLDKSKAEEHIKDQFLEMAEKFRTQRATKENFYARYKQLFRKKYLELVEHKWFSTGLAWFFILRGVIVLIGVALTLATIITTNTINPNNPAGFFEWGLLLSSVLANILIVIGLFKYRKDHIIGLKWFRISTLITIFAYTFFAFYFNQLTAIIGLSFDILILYALEILIAGHTKHSHK